ncbi:MAG: hypothetical protein JWN48_2904 [Myxococcaceae bacterium]|nr:hypothetical protein [Myxococcaceae bacterium]
MQQVSVVQRGRFELAKGYVRGEWLRHGGLALALLLFGCGMAVYGAYVVRDLLDVARVWREGREGLSEVGYTGQVVSHYAMLKKYDLKVTYVPEDAEDPVTFEAEFHRFFTGPDEGDPMTVKYEPSAPRHAVSSWQEEGLTHGWVWAAVVWLLAACGVLTPVLIVRELVSTIAKVRELSHEGQLMRAQVEDLKTGGSHKNPLLVVRYKTPRGETTKQTFFLKRGEPYLLDDGQVMVLSAIDERRSYALRADGYPLAHRPAALHEAAR